MGIVRSHRIQAWLAVKRLREGRDSSSTGSTAKETLRGDWASVQFPVSRNDSDLTFEQQAAEQHQRPILESFEAGGHGRSTHPADGPLRYNDV